MKEILKPVFEWLTGNYNLFDNFLYNYVVMAIIGLIAFGVAWKIVGKLYDIDIISGRVTGSIIHWVVRFIAFIIIFTGVSVTIWIVKLIIVIPVWVWLVVFGILIITIMCIMVRYFLKKEGNHQ